MSLLKPTLAALDELAKSYNVSVVLCSATMPAVTRRDDFRIGLKDVREIVDQPDEMALAMRRADVRVIGHLDDNEVADRTATARRVLTIVNTRAHAARLYQLVKERTDDVLHLSALMCPEHRSERVAEIKDRLKHDRPCRVISTQVVEAGVDIDFPIVYRAIAGLDSIVQAAGRCNREGRGPRGKVFVFDTDLRPPPGILGPINSTRQVLTDNQDPLDLGTITRYFQYHFWTRSREWDGGIGQDGKPVGITDMLNVPDLKLRTAAGCYRLIDQWAEPRMANLRRNEVGGKVPVGSAGSVMNNGRGRLGVYVEEDRQQRAATLLRNVEYVIEAHFEIIDPRDADGTPLTPTQAEAKHLDQFNRRARAGQCFQRPYLGCREFVAQFELIEGDLPRSPLAGTPEGNRDLGYMLHDIDFSRSMAARFFRATMVDGVINVPPPESTEVRS